MSHHNITILGGSGFVGHQLVARLAREGHNITIPCRHPERQRTLTVNPTVRIVQGNIHDQETLHRLFSESSVVINLVGILNEGGGNRGSFRDIHTKFSQTVQDATRHTPVERLLHMSALGADPAYGSSEYLRSKGDGENIAHNPYWLQATSFRPSVIFGPGDSFFNRFASLLKLSPLPFPLACHNAQFAPIYIGDVVEAFARALDNPACYGQRYDLCGPQHYTLQQLVSYTAELLGLKRNIIGLSDRLSRWQAHILERLPGKLFSYDNYLSMQQPSVCDKPFPEVFQINPRAIEEIVPGYLQSRTERQRYNSLRREAGRG